MSAPTCREIRPRLSAHLEDDLEPGAARETRAHIEECAACRTELELLRRTVGALRNLPDLPPPAGILAGVRSRLQPAPWYRRLPDNRSWLFGIPVGALATLVIVFGISLFQARHPEMRQTVSRAPVAPAVPGFAPSAASAPAVEAERFSPEPQAPAPPSRKTVARAKSAAKDRPPVAGVKSEHREETVAAAPPRAIESKSAPARADRAEAQPETVAGQEPSGEVRPAAPSHFVIPDPEPADGRTAMVDEDPGGRPQAMQGPPHRPWFGTGTLEGKPREVSTLKDDVKGAPAPPPTRKFAAAARRVEPREQEIAKAPVEENEYRTLGTTASTNRSELPGLVTLHPAGKATQTATAPLHVVCLLLPNGATVESLARVLRREGATGVEITALDRRALSEASSAYRTRTDIVPGISRGWTVTAVVPGWALTGLLDALSGNNGLRVLEMPPARGDLPGSLALRITVLR